MERNSWGVSIFSDDVRFELGGKTSIMGVYLMDFILPSQFPLIIQKLFITVRYYELVGIFTDDPILKVYLPGATAPFFEQRITRPKIEASAQVYPLDGDGDKVVFINLVLPFQNLLISEEGTIRVRMHCGDVVTRLGALSVRSARPEEQALF